MSWIRLKIQPGVDSFDVGRHYAERPRVRCGLSWNSEKFPGLVFLESEYQLALQELIPDIKKDPRVIGYEVGSKFFKNIA